MLSFVIIVASLSLTLWGPRLSADAGDQESASLLLLLGGNYQSPQRCRECHGEEFESWSDTSHANALFDPIFRTYLEQADRPGECMACHTTGYDNNTGEFVLAGVTCEACHGPYREGHPEQSMSVVTSPDFCGDCHVGTLAEWQTSRHGAAGVLCVDCHEVHLQEARVASTTNALCASCHEETVNDTRHLVHSDAEIPCIECHLDRPDQVPVNGHLETGHSFSATNVDCDECHLW